MVRTYNANGVSVAEILNHTLDISNFSIISGQLMEVLEKSGCSRLVLDLHQLASVDSVGISLLAKVRDKAREKGIDIVVTGASAYIVKIFEILNMKEFITSAARLEDIIANS